MNYSKENSSEHKISTKWGMLHLYNITVYLTVKHKMVLAHALHALYNSSQSRYDLSTAI